jgi:hypothetical protein
MKGIRKYKYVEMPEKNMVLTLIEGEEFIFDTKGYKLFLEEFNADGFYIIIHQGYLARKNELHEEWDPQYFHRWLKLVRTSQKNIDSKKCHVHHNNLNIRDNRLKNLIFVHKEYHHIIHKKKKAYQTYKRKFLENDPEATPQKINYFWNKFKEDNFIDDDC